MDEDTRELRRVAGEAGIERDAPFPEKCAGVYIAAAVAQAAANFEPNRPTSDSGKAVEHLRRPELQSTLVWRPDRL